MKVCVQSFAVAVLVSLFSFCTVEVARAASSTLVLYTEETVTVVDEYGEYEYTEQTIIHTLEEGGTYAVDLDTEYNAYLTSDVAAYIPEGYLYKVVNNSREFVSQVGGYDPLIWGQAGEYEIDFYDTEPPILSQQSWWRRIVNIFILPKIAYAQTPALFLETIHFTITDENAVAECCSSVIFLPGIKGSVLKTETDTLWPPTIWSTDVAQLGLTEDGESVNEVFVDGMLSTFYGVPVYEGFGSFMNSLVADGTIENWEPLPYDWRFSPEYILENGVKTEDGVLDLLDQIEVVADASPTGQVTIVAHSMGGLMGKAIIRKLRDEGKEGIIDSFVMVGTPQLGTPQAITSMLHGEGESILAGRIIDAGVTRLIAQNMPASYNLLPSARYFQEVSDPVITFKDNDWYTSSWRAYWGLSLNSYSKYLEFLTGEGVERADPLPGVLSMPEILRTDLIADAANFHEQYDTFEFPPDIRVVQVAGWGISTIKSVLYRSRHLVLPSYEPDFTVEGDGTVVYPSAVSSEGEQYFFDIFDYSEQVGTEYSHKDILNTNPVQFILKGIVQEQEIEESEFVTISKPTTSEAGTQLLVSTHSPVLLGVHDSDGNFTGISGDSNPSLTIQQDIPGSSFREFGDSQYIFLPKDGQYTFTYQGTGIGSTTVEIETFSNDTRTPVATFTDIPTTVSTQARFIIESAVPENTSIELDKNGDGVYENVIKKDGSEPTLDELMVLLKSSVENMNLKPAIKTSLLNKIALLKLSLAIKDQKLRNIAALFSWSVLKLEVDFLKKKRLISEADALLLLEILNNIKKKI